MARTGRIYFRGARGCVKGWANQQCENWLGNYGSAGGDARELDTVSMPVLPLGGDTGGTDGKADADKGGEY